MLNNMIASSIELPNHIIEQNNQVINERIVSDYNMLGAFYRNMKRKINILQIEFDMLEEEQDFYLNQRNTARQVLSSFNDKKIIANMVYAKTQSGKTGTMNYFIKIFTQINDIPIENIFILTPLSDIDWLDQTKRRTPESLHKNIYHRGTFKKMLNEIKGKKNILLLIDEVHIASKEGQSLYKMFQESRLYNKQYLLENDIKIVEFSATPGDTLYDLQIWKSHSNIEKMIPGDNYIDINDIASENRLFEYKDLCCYDKKLKKVNYDIAFPNILELFRTIQSFLIPRYHIIRTPGGYEGTIVKDNLKRIFNDYVDYYKYDSESDIKNINEMLNKKPSKHTVILIKGKLRCAKTLNKKYIGVLYERYAANPKMSAILQGLAGRATGYHTNNSIIVFSNKKMIEKYNNLWTNDFKNEKPSITNSFQNPNYFEGMESNESPKENNEILTKIFDECNNIEDNYKIAVEFIKSYYPGSRPKNKPSNHLNNNGFYECKVRYNKKVWNIDELENDKKGGINGKNKYRIRYAYSDINNKDTVKIVLHYKKKDQ